eukprot:Clim_evm4s32 gene=Clim_evmTU4s32
MGLSVLEFVFGVGLATYVIGPQQLPAVARQVGRTAGSAVRIISSYRDTVYKQMAGNKAGEIERQLEEAYDDLARVRRDIRGGISLSRRVVSYIPSSRGTSKTTASESAGVDQLKDDEQLHTVTPTESASSENSPTSLPLFSSRPLSRDVPIGVQPSTGSSILLESLVREGRAQLEKLKLK